MLAFKMGRFATHWHPYGIFPLDRRDIECPGVLPQEVSAKWKVAPEQILGRSRERRVSLARRQFLVQAHEEAKLSAAKLSRICGITHVSVRQALLKGSPPEGISLE